MIKILKTGTNNYGKWVCFEFLTDLMVINGIAKTNLDLEEKTYNNLTLVINQRNSKISFNIIEKK